MDKSSQFYSTLTLILRNLSTSRLRLIKLGTFKEEVSNIIFRNFECHRSLGSKVHFFISLEIVFYIEILRFFKKNNQNVLFSTFLALFEWCLCDKYTKSNRDIKFSCQTF